MSLNINVLVTAREEYINQLMNILIPYYKNNFKKIFENSQVNSYIKYKLRPFQEELRYIQKWNEVTIDTRVKELTNQYPYFGELLKAIFVINVKILSCVKTNPKGKGIKIEIPQIQIFVHKLFIEIARKLYYKPNTILSNDEDLEYLIELAIHDSLRNQIPIQQILQEYLMDTFDDSEDEEQSEEEEPIDKQEETIPDEPKEISTNDDTQPNTQPNTQNDTQQEILDFTAPNQNQEQQTEQPTEQTTEQPIEKDDYLDDEIEQPNINPPPPSPSMEPRRPVLFEDAKHFN